MMEFTASPDDVAAILLAAIDEKPVTLIDPGEPLEELAIVVSETMRIATIEHKGKDQFEVKHIHCYAPVHGSHPRHAELTKALAEYNKRQNANIVCPICSGSNWLPTGGSDAKTGISFAISLGIFRGVQLPETKDILKARETSTEKAFSHVLNNPLVTRVREELERREAEADDQG
jgi:hypothetical protein